MYYTFILYKLTTQQDLFRINKKIFKQVKHQMRPLDYDTLHINDKQRFKTDIPCTLLGAAFALTMFIAACVMWNRQNFDKKFSFYNGSNSQAICGEGKFIYYENYQDLTKVQCVDKCPVLYTEHQGLCIPMQSKKKQQFFTNPDLAVGFFGQKFKWVLLYTAGISLALGLLRVSFINFFPRLSVKLQFYLCILSLIGVGVLLLVLYDTFWKNINVMKLIIAILCFLLALFVIMMLCFYRKEVKVYEIFVDYAVHHLKSNPKTYLYIPVFILLSIGLVVLITWQHFCYVSRLGANRNIYDYSNSGLWGYFNLIQFWWGFHFLRDAFNFCVSGNTIDKLWNAKVDYCFGSFCRLICKNWGSVVGGSFYNAFFQIPSIIYQLILCKPKTLCGKVGVFCYKNCNCLSICFDLIRTDAYPYINLSGMSFCNAASECRRLCDTSQIFVGIHSPMHNYRLIAHLFTVSCLLIVCSFILKNFMEYYGVWNYILIAVVIMMAITWFIGIISDTAEAIQVSFLSQYDNFKDFSKMRIIQQPYLSDLEHLERRIYRDGNC